MQARVREADGGHIWQMAGTSEASRFDQVCVHSHKTSAIRVEALAAASSTQNNVI